MQNWRLIMGKQIPRKAEITTYAYLFTRKEKIARLGITYLDTYCLVSAGQD